MTFSQVAKLVSSMYAKSGFKFDDQDYRDALWPISSDLPFLMDHFTVAIADLAAEVIAEQCFGCVRAARGLKHIRLRSCHRQANISLP